MEPLQSALCLLLGSALPLGVVAILVRRGMRQFAVSSAYAEVSRQLGLEVDTRGTSLQGHLGDRRIWIGEVMVGHGPARQMVTWGVLDLARPLGLGLRVRRKDRRSRLLRRGRAAPSATGDPELDRVLEVQGDDPERVRALFDPAVCTALSHLLARWPDAALTDGAVRVHLAAPEARAEDLRRLVAAMLSLAEALERARRQVDPPARLTEALDWLGALCEERGLELEPWLPAASGTLDGHRVLVACRRQPEGYRAVVRLWFADHPRTGLRLRRQQAPDGYWSVGQDIQIGDPQVDQAFVIKGWDPEYVVGLLTPQVRAPLLALAELGRPEVDDRGLVVEELALDRAVVERALEAARTLAESLDW